MTRKDYVLIAQALKDSSPDDRWSNDCKLQWVNDCESIADALADDNLRFDRDRFLKACGVQS